MAGRGFGPRLGRLGGLTVFVSVNGGSFAVDCSWRWMAIFQPTSLDASLTLIPFLPMARDSWSLGTIACMILASWSRISIRSTRAGLRAALA